MAAGCRWRTQKGPSVVLPSSHLPDFGARMASPVLRSRTFLQRLAGVGLGMSYSFLECPLVPFKGSSSISPVSLPSPGNASLILSPHTLQAELGAFLSVSQPALGKVLGAVPELGTWALRQQDVAPALWDSWSRGDWACEDTIINSKTSNLGER